MRATSYQIRLCENPACGLRYPLTESHPFGARCPLCLSQTKVLLERPLEREQIADVEQLPSDTNLSVLLDNVRSARNVGSIFRSADGFEFRHAFLCGITPTPENADVHKTALGAEEFVTWSVHRNAVKLVKGLKTEGWEILALERTENSKPLDRKLKIAKATVLVVGSEVTGVDPAILDLADEIVHLPMRGQKRSFNAAVSFAVAAQIIRSRC